MSRKFPHCDTIGFPKRKLPVKPLLRTPALVVLVLCALVLGSCSKSETAASGNAGPPSELDLAIANYDKVAKQYVHVAKQKQKGDVSVTMRFLNLRDQTRAAAKKVETQASQLTPPQRKRVALIAAETKPFLVE